MLRALDQITRNIVRQLFDLLFRKASRFENLVREIIYDYKDWQTIDATGQSGDDDGFDIRAFERVAGYKEDSRDTRHRVEDYWDHLPNRNKEFFFRKGLVEYNSMLVIERVAFLSIA